MGFRKVTVEDKQQYRIAYKENMIIDDTALLLPKCIENCNGKLRKNTFFYFEKGAIVGKLKRKKPKTGKKPRTG